MLKSHRFASVTTSLLLLCLTALAASCGPTDGPAPDDQVSGGTPGTEVSGLTFPYVREPACPGEGCSFGEWMACDVIPVYAALGETTTVEFELADGERFEVETGAVRVQRPGIVVVTEPVQNSEYAVKPILFQPGDTLLILDYLGEGFFNVFHQDTIVETEVFWRWKNFSAPDVFYRGDVIQEGIWEFWVRVRNGADQEGWLLTDGARLAAAYSLVDEPLECYQEPQA